MTHDEANLRAIARDRVAQRRGFQIDLLLYVIINVALWALWLLLWPEDYSSFPWPILVTGGWGIGLIAHGVLTWWTLSGADDAAIEREMEKLRR